MIDLPNLTSRFRSYRDRETAEAWYKTATPWIGDLAYFNVIFKPAPALLLSTVATRLRAPKALVELLSRHNGAELFGGRLAIYGVVAENRLLDRDDPFSLPPFDIERVNRGWNVDPETLLVVGFYQSDGSHVCISRQDAEVTLFRPGRSNPSFGWHSLDDWLVTEIERFGAYFHSDGRLIGDSELISPPSK